MDIKSKLTVYCGISRPRRNAVVISSLASALGAELVVVDWQNPNLVRVELYTEIEPVVVSNYETELYKLMGIDLTILAGHIRETLVEQVADLICEGVRESITPPPPYVETAGFFEHQKIFLASTGNREKDRKLTDEFNKYIPHLLEILRIP